MSKSVGINAGVSGVLDVPGASGAKLQGTMVGFGQKLTATKKPRRGRGGSKWAGARTVVASGSLAIVGQISLTAPPLPSGAWEDQEGTLTLQAGFANDASQTEAMAVRVTGAEFKLNEKSKDTWDFIVTCDLTATPTWAGFGTQPAATAATKTDQEQWGEATTKTQDPNGLLSGATRLTDVWGSLADTDAAEATRLAVMVAAALPPLAGLKLRTATFTRDSDDGGTVVETWGLTSSADDVVNARASKTIDPAGIGSNATVAAINGTPAAPTGDNFLLRGTTTGQLNDGNTVTVRTYGKTTTAQDIEFPETYARYDASGLTSEGKQVSVFAATGSAPAATVPAGLQQVSSAVFSVNPDQKKVEYLFAKDTTQQKLEQENTYTLTDPQGLESEARVAALDSTPSTPAGYYVRGSKAQKTTHDHTLNTIICGVRSTKDDREMPGTWYRIDPRGIETEGSDVKVYDTGDTAPTVSPANGTKIVATKTEVIDHVHSQQTVTLGLADSADRVLNPKNTSSTDPQLLKGTVDIAVFSTDSAPTTPAGYKLVATLDALLPEGKTVRVYRYALADSRDEAEFEHTRTTTDPNDLTSETVLGAVFTTGSPPSDPSLPSGQKLVEKFDVPLTAADTSNLSVRVYRWGKLDSKDKLALPETFEDVDPNGLRTRKAVASVDATPSTPAGLALRSTKTTHPAPGHTLVTVEAGTRSTVDDVEMPETWTDVDPAGIDSRARDATVYLASGGVPSTPVTPVAGLVVVNEHVEQIDQLNSKKVVDYGTLTSAEKVEHQSTSATYDPIDNYEKETGTVTACLSSDTEAALAATAFAANQGTSTFAGVAVTKINRLLARTIIRAKNDDKRVSGELVTRREKVLGVAATPGSWSASAVAAQVRVARIPTLGGNNTQALIQHVEVDRTRGVFTIRRRVIVTSEANETTALHIGDLGTLNNATLLGCAAHTLKYSGPKILHDRKLLGSAHLLLVEYNFEYDNYCHMNLSKLAYGWVPTASPTTYISVVGDIYPATTYFCADMQITYPAEASLSWAVT